MYTFAKFAVSVSSLKLGWCSPLFCPSVVLKKRELAVPTNFFSSKQWGDEKESESHVSAHATRE